MKNKKVTAMDVARLAGVSQSSVSRAFSENSSISIKKKKIILEAAEQLGYQPNAIARGLITNQSRIIGIVMRNIQNPFFPEVLDRFYSRLSEKGYHVMFINSQNNEIQEEEVSHLIEYSVEGAIITDALLTSSAVQKFTRNGISVVLFNRYVNDSLSNAVVCDNFAAGKKIGHYLIEKGHENLAFISGPVNTSTTVDRRNGFQSALAEHGITSFLKENGLYSYRGGYIAAQRLLEQDKDIDAIFCSNDISAFGAIDYLRKQGIRVPEDISIIGFDNVAMADWSSYALTTWHQPIDEMVDSSIELLLNNVNGEVRSPEIQRLEGHLVERGSVMDRR
ncbi:LacI family DNA-binding transcriptional regulator [Pseudalkalibacillus caeni]|uniref:LacI family DNA-binding transcriptional regulator n=1 Tax=Exobacillus caeni TaxID=2574798 RepID=A0A5R9F134_9BACL|nr:LacI family DNA-binding transcriptional regulator [Pseudalkalibacillus caeni]TLS36711.1 LacI family DNA-binding transcriptional regulator [Pseudalkalibacillus caeni]